MKRHFDPRNIDSDSNVTTTKHDKTDQGVSDDLLESIDVLYENSDSPLKNETVEKLGRFFPKEPLQPIYDSSTLNVTSARLCSSCACCQKCA